MDVDVIVVTMTQNCVEHTMKLLTFSVLILNSIFPVF